MKGGAVVALELGLLGSIEARMDGRLMELGRAQQRLLLAALLMDINREVPIDQLADRIWGEGHAQRGTLYAYLSRLRKALAGADEVEIVRRPAGYVLVADPTVVDLYRFRDLVARAHAGDAEQAFVLFGQALGLWRGEALAGAGTPWAGAVRQSLHRERLAAELDHAEVRLRLGRHAELVSRLRGLAAQYPLNERLAGQLMLALHRSGCTAEALGHYQDTRRALTEELEIEPGPELRRLHQQILTGDSALAAEPVAGVYGSTSQMAAEVTTRAAVETLVLRQLPASPALFTGRTRELDRLSAALDEQSGPSSTVVISAIGGVGGLGKTYLALHWAHTHLERFPDGQLFVNLRGFDPTAKPMDPSEAVRGFLEGLSVAPSAIPESLDAQTALFRSLVAGKRMLVVLDNAHDTTQVLPLLPGSPTCTVLVTSRRQLTGLVTTQGAAPLPLDALPEEEARALLVRHLGKDRLAAEPDAVAALLAHCAGLPLALSIIAARAATQPDLPLAHLTEELDKTETRLEALDTGELTTSLRAVFASSYRTLPPEAARVFALLGLAPGPDISLHAAANLIGRSTARAMLRTLEDAHLIRQHALGRYRMHDLVHLYAAEHGHTLPAQDRDPALRRLIDFYLYTTHHVSTSLDPQHLLPLELEPPAPGCTPLRPTDLKAALAWYDAERACLPAIQQLTVSLGWHTPTWQLPHTLMLFYWYRGHLRDALSMGKVGLTAAERSSSPRPAATTHSHLGYAYGLSRQLTTALHHLDQALAVFEQTGDLLGQAFTHYNYYVAVTFAGQDPQRGAHHAERASRLYHALGHTTGECFALSSACWCHAQLGNHQQAIACGEQAVTLGHSLSGPGPVSYALTTLGFALRKSGQYTEALGHHHQAIARFRDFGDTYGEAMILAYLGRTHQALGQTVEARHAWQRARDIFRTQHRTFEAERVQRRLDSLDDDARADE